MPATLLLWNAESRSPEDPDPSKRGPKKGSCFALKDEPSVWGTAEGPPDWVRLTITDKTADELDAYMRKWVQDLDFKDVTHQPTPNDRFDATLHAKNFRASDGCGAVTRDQVENYLAGWNVIVEHASANAVEVRYFIAQVATSRQFWDADVSDVTFELLSYEPSTGEHQIRADYSAAPWPPDRVELRVSQIARLIVHDRDNRTIDYAVMRDDVNARAKEGVKADIEDWCAKRQLYFDDVGMTFIDNRVTDPGRNTGGHAEATAAEAAPFVRNSVND